MRTDVPALRLVRGGGGLPSDDELLRAFLTGEAAAFGELVRRHQATVRAVVRRYAADGDDVLDLAQRAFLRALEAARRGRWLRLGRLPPWRPLLLRIAVNLGKNHARDTARWKRAPLALLDGGTTAVEPRGTDRLEEEERARAVRALVASLPRRQRQVLSLRIDAELPFSEIARVLGITENNAKVHFHHASRRLAALVAGREP